MKILVQAYSSNSDAVTCNYAIITIDHATLARYRTIASNVADACDSFNALTLWDFSAEFYEDYCPPDTFLTADQADRLALNQFVVLSDDFDPGLVFAKDDDNPMRTDANLAYVSDTDVYWQALVKHSDVRVETFTIPFNAIL